MLHAEDDEGTRSRVSADNSAVVGRFVGTPAEQSRAMPELAAADVVGTEFDDKHGIEPDPLLRLGSLRDQRCCGRRRQGDRHPLQRAGSLQQKSAWALISRLRDDRPSRPGADPVRPARFDICFQDLEVSLFGLFQLSVLMKTVRQPAGARERSPLKLLAEIPTRLYLHQRMCRNSEPSS
jgi:hypothetical protein